MDIKKIENIKKYPYLGYSPNLIEYFLIIGFNNSFKVEKAVEISLSIKDIIASVEKLDNPELEGQELKEKLNFHKMPNKPVVLNSIASDFSDGMINEDNIINYLFPNHYTPIYSINIKNEKNEKNEKSEKTEKTEKNEKIEPPNQNLIFYLSIDKICENNANDDAHTKEEMLLNKNIMFNVYGYLFWESQNVDNYKIFFPKVFVFISQYSFFKFFSFLSQNILFRIRKNIYFEIPLEIQLYNIINYTPSPICSDLQLDLLANIDLVSLKKSDKELAVYQKVKDGEKGEKVNLVIPNDNNNITLSQLSGYPYFDIDLSFLFNYFNFESFFTTYLFSFLEFKMIFFSPSLDFLNTIMYIIRFLSYPFIDNKDLGQIYSISKEDFLYGSDLIENNLIGVNCAYDPKMTIPSFYKDYFIISFDLKLITIYYNGQNINNYNGEGGNNIMKLINYIENSIVEEVEKKYFLQKKIHSMFNSLYQCFRVIMNNNNINNANNNTSTQTKDFFKELDLSESNYKNYDYLYDEYKEYNSTIQKAFYAFNLSIYEFFHDTMKLTFFENENNVLNDYKSIYYGIKFDLLNDKGDENEKLFFEYFTKTSKYNQFINLFLKNNLCCDLNRPSMICAEEFININKALEKDETKDFIQILNNFYQNSNKVVKIDFTKFYLYYSENLAKTIYDMALDTKVIKLTYEMKNNIKKIIYRQKECLLDDNLLKRYVYILNNMETKNFVELFPSLTFKQNENIIPEINSTLFADLLEANLLDDKFYSVDEIVSFIVLMIYVITLKRNIIIFHFFEEIMAKMKINRKILLRKYIYLILYILNDNVNIKLQKKENIIKELLLYKEIMSCIYNTNVTNKYNNKCYYPNERLADIIYNFNIYQKKFEELLQEKKEYQKQSKTAIYHYNNESDKDILEDGVDYKVLLQNNACRDKGAIKDEVLIKISEALEYKGLIQTTCKTCQLKIRPNLFFVHVPIDRSGQAGFYSICYSYRIALDVLRFSLNNNFAEKEDDFFNVVANMIYYISFKEGINNKISNYLATCLK